MNVHEQAEQLIEHNLQIQQLIKDRDDHEKRLRHLEQHWAKASGALIAISGLIQIVLHFLHL